ncbi:hypothetical protein Tco_0957372 [Tanacetum coccineum]
MIGEQSESTTRIRPQQLPLKDKGKAIMEEPEKPTKRKDQIRHDEEVAQRLQAQMQAELEEEDRLAREKEKEANIVSWDNMQAMIDVDYQMAQQMQKKNKINMNTELVEGSEKRAGEELIAESSPSIVDWKIHKEGKKSYYQIIKADGSSKISTRPVEDLDLVLYGDLKTMFEPHVEDNVWKNQSDYRVLDWKLYDSCGVHSLRKQNVHIHMLVEKRYPLIVPTIIDMLNRKLQADH